MTLLPQELIQKFDLAEGEKFELIHSLEKSSLLQMYKNICLTRAFEEKVDQINKAGMMHGPAMLSIGMEAVSAGSITAILPGDYIIHHHRGHGHTISKGGNPMKMFAEIMGREAGYSHGRGGTMHIADLTIGDLGATGIVGAGISTGVGVALSLKMDKNGKVLLCFFGDGATNTGDFHESLNLASVWKLPIVFICENNQYGISMAIDKAVNIQKISERASSYGMPGITTNGNDVLAVYQAVTRAVSFAREGEGPTLVESLTYRVSKHNQNGKEQYRPAEEVASWQELDPISRFRSDLIQHKIVIESALDNINRTARDDVETAYSEALNCPEPTSSYLESEVFSS